MIGWEFEVVGIGREGSSIRMDLAEYVRETPAPPLGGEGGDAEEKRIREKLDIMPEPRTDTDRVMVEMMESLKHYAPGAYHAVRSGQMTPSRIEILPFPRPMRQRRLVSMSLSEDDYKALGSPPLLSLIRLRMSKATK